MYNIGIEKLKTALFYFNQLPVPSLSECIDSVVYIKNAFSSYHVKNVDEKDQNDIIVVNEDISNKSHASNKIKIVNEN